MTPGRAWSDADILPLLNFKRKSLLAGDLDAKYQFWNSVHSDTSDDKVLHLFDIKEFEISAVLYAMYYCAEGNYLPDIVLQQNVRLLKAVAHITYQSYFTCCITLGLGLVRAL